jgi:stringent starvation protein B
MAETSTKPYMIRALYEWCCDNGYTPYLAVAVDAHTIVPRQHVKGGEIVLNVSPMATNHLTIGNEMVEFQARFSGVAQQISVPVTNISAIYARETGHGMAFDVSKAIASQEGEDGGDQSGAAENAEEAGDEDGARGDRVAATGARGVIDEAGGLGGDSAPAAEEERIGAADLPADGPAAGPRKRPAGSQGSADVIAFARSSNGGKKKGASRSRAGADEEATAKETGAGEHDDEPPPQDGGGKTGKGGKARLTRVK